MDQRSFQKLLRRTVAIPVILLVLLAATLLIEIMTLTSSLKWVDHAERVISNSRQLMRYMVDMETGVRGYHLTGDKTFLEPYEAAKARISEQLALLIELTADNPSQQQRLKQVGELDLRWMQRCGRSFAAACRQTSFGAGIRIRQGPDGPDTSQATRDC